MAGSDVFFVIKDAYKKKVWESHPDLFPFHEKPRAESQFKLISEAYNCLLSGAGGAGSSPGHRTFSVVNQPTRVWFRSYAISFAVLCFSNSKLVPSWLTAYSRVVRTGVPRAQGGRRNPVLIRIPFLLIIFGTLGLGGLSGTRAYRRQKEVNPSHNPFLP